MKPEDREASAHVPPPRVQPFRAGQRRALAIAITIFIACLAVALLRNPSHVDDPMPGQGPRYEQLVDRLDPNVADAESLSALPQLGPRRARDIVKYRERVRATDPQRVVFTKLDDLLRVRGIGYAMTKHVEPYLVFPVTQPATAPSPGTPGEGGGEGPGI